MICGQRRETNALLLIIISRSLDMHSQVSLYATGDTRISTTWENRRYVYAEPSLEHSARAPSLCFSHLHISGTQGIVINFYFSGEMMFSFDAHTTDGTWSPLSLHGQHVRDKCDISKQQKCRNLVQSNVLEWWSWQSYTRTCQRAVTTLQKWAAVRRCCVGAA